MSTVKRLALSGARRLPPCAESRRHQTVSRTAPNMTATASGSPAHIFHSGLVLIANRARTLGDQVSASRTRYFVVRDTDLLGQPPDAILKRLSPTPISAAGPSGVNPARSALPRLRPAEYLDLPLGRTARLPSGFLASSPRDAPVRGRSTRPSTGGPRGGHRPRSDESMRSSATSPTSDRGDLQPGTGTNTDGHTGCCACYLARPPRGQIEHCHAGASAQTLSQYAIEVELQD